MLGARSVEAQSVAHARFPTLFSVGQENTSLLEYPSENLLKCVALHPDSGLPNVISSGNSLHAIPEQASYVETLQQVDGGGNFIDDHFVVAVCPSLPQPSERNPHPRPSRAQHFSCYFPRDFLNPQFIFHGKYAGAFRASMQSTGASVVIKRIDMRRLKTLRTCFLKLVAREKVLLQRLSSPFIPRMIFQYVDPLDEEFVYTPAPRTSTGCWYCFDIVDRYFVLQDGGVSNVMNLLRASMMTSTVLQPSIIKKIMIDVRPRLFMRRICFCRLILSRCFPPSPTSITTTSFTAT